jgi:hypothetical protein
MKPESRDAMLTAIAKARKWIEDIRLGRLAPFAAIAEREAVGERHIRLLAPLSFLSPHIIAAIVDGTAPADLTVTGLAKALPYSWAEQERRIGLRPPQTAAKPSFIVASKGPKGAIIRVKRSGRRWKRNSSSKNQLLDSDYGKAQRWNHTVP